MPHAMDVLKKKSCDATQAAIVKSNVSKAMELTFFKKYKMSRYNLFILFAFQICIQQVYSQEIAKEPSIYAPNFNIEQVKNKRDKLNIEIKQLQNSLLKIPQDDNIKARLEELILKKQLLLEIELLLKEKELRNEQEKSKKYINISIILGIFSLVLLIFGIIVFLFLKERSWRKSIYQELNKYKLISLNQQLNPHFIYNALSSIQHYILKADKIKANEYITSFAKLMRDILANSQKDLISIINEVEAIRLYLKLELLRFEDRFMFKIECDDEILYNKIPAFLLQPFIENALWHGLLHKNEHGTVTIILKKVADTIFILVEDDGIGRQESQRINSKKKMNKDSYGILLSERRINLLNKAFYKSQAKLRIIDLKDGDAPIGTRVEIELPILN
jgi:hypothetical protein